MGNVTKMLLCGLVLAIGSSSLLAQDAVSLKRKAQNKLLAQRAARADAIRKLAERIRGLRITSETTVKDFVTENDTINTAMVAFLSGMKEKKVTHMEDGTCEVVMEVALQDVVVNLKQMHSRYYKGDKIKINDFEQMSVCNGEIKILTETGMGAPRPETWENGGGEMMPVKDDLVAISNMSAAAKEFWMANVQPQGRLMAVRAARVDGMRRLAERIKGLQVTSETTVKDFVTESDVIQTIMSTFLQGAKEKGIRYHEDELIVEVEMAVTLRTVYASLKQYVDTHYKGDRVKMTAVEQLSTRVEDKEITEIGQGVPPEKYLKNAGKVVATGLQTPEWATQRLRAVGNAAIDTTNDNAAQAKLMAFRGAELDARRKLAEQIQGLLITSETSVKDFVTSNDEIQTNMLAFQQDAHVVEGSQKVMEDGTAEVTVEIEMRPLWNMITKYREVVIKKTR